MEATCSAQGRVSKVPRVSKRVKVACIRITTYKPVVSKTSVLRLRAYFSFAWQGRSASNNGMQRCKCEDETRKTSTRLARDTARQFETRRYHINRRNVGGERCYQDGRPSTISFFRHKAMLSDLKPLRRGPLGIQILASCQWEGNRFRFFFLRTLFVDKIRKTANKIMGRTEIK